MPYNYRISKNLERILDKLFRKDRVVYDQIMKKINEIINSSDIEHYKNLKYNLSDRKRVHIGHFVLVFKFNKIANLVEFDDFDHHDKIYNR